MDSPSLTRVAAVRHARKGARFMAERINEEGWRLLNVANESLQFDIRTTSLGDRRFEQEGRFFFYRCIFRKRVYLSCVGGYSTIGS